MKPGDLVRYKLFPHKELHESDMVGLVVHVEQTDYPTATAVVLWNCDRPQASMYEPQLDYLDEIEVVSEAK
jgi:hypothetical protein